MNGMGVKSLPLLLDLWGQQRSPQTLLLGRDDYPKGHTSKKSSRWYLLTWVILGSITLHAASRNQDHFGRENWDHQLKLAVAWNRVDIARSEIFTDDHDWKVGPSLCCLSGLQLVRPGDMKGTSHLGCAWGGF